MMTSKHGVRQSVIQLFVIALCLTNLHGASSECTINEWDCDDGQCIQDDLLCDGKVNCDDGSDEIPENCIHFQDICLEFGFKCSYGACIDRRLMCNGERDCADNSDELLCQTKNVSDIQGSCSDTEMQCLSSKECISKVLLCDGVKHCEDGFDESLEVCIKPYCQSSDFQCGNGACISDTLKCNGEINCADGSDEAWELCKTPRKKNKTPAKTQTPTPRLKRMTPESEGCHIPNITSLQNLQFRLHPQNETIALGSHVESSNVVHIECKNQYKLTGQQSLLCLNDQWNKDFPTCDGYCDGTILNKLSLKSLCDIRERFVQCPEKIEPGTSIRANCAFGYTRSKNEDQFIKCLPDGSFDKKPERCEQVCGKVPASPELFSENGTPWHVTIFEKTSVDYSHICGGTIISPTIVITAAHCFWDEANTILKSYTEYQIIAGRNTNKYTTEESSHSQIINVKEIHIPKEYRGREERQKLDIAFLSLATPLKYSTTIAPICLSKDIRNSASKYMASNRTGFINSFGRDNQLERMEVLTLQYFDCVEKSPIEAPVADDKFCIYITDGGMVCRGDGGGGFFTSSVLEETREVIYRLWGVISNTPTTRNDCTRTGDQAYVAITNIYQTPLEFLERLRIAREKDEELL